MITDYTVVVTVLSIRFKRPGVYERLKRGAAQRAESLSSAGERLIDEGLIAETAEQLWLTERQVRTVSRYYAEFTDEIDSEIAENDEAAEREYAAWKNARKLLTG